MMGFDPHRVQYLAVIGSLLLLAFILELIRRRRIKESYSLLWLGTGIVFIVFSVWRSGLELMARMVGIAYPPAAFLLLLVMAIFLILIQFSVIISKLSESNKRLIQEVGLLREQLRTVCRDRGNDGRPTT